MYIISIFMKIKVDTTNRATNGKDGQADEQARDIDVYCKRVKTVESHSTVPGPVYFI